jgi:hypothetical protein
MPHWIPETKWQGEDVFIIGGGNSLKDFDWSLLEDECTVGCNSAFTLGEKICKICIFGDAKWFRKYQDELKNYKGVVFTNAEQLRNTRLNWLWTMPRKAKGLGTTSLGWNSNTGASAINLALILGAQRVFLLGFDMHLSKEGKRHWHNKTMGKTDKNVYEKFILAFTKVAVDLKTVFPGKEVINVTDNSDLDVFPKVGCKQFWKERKLMN